MIEVNSICKYYGDFPAVTDVSFTIENYGVYGFLGPNGAGKSTTLRTIAGLVKPKAGKIMFDGEDITGKDPAYIVGKGITLVPEGRRIFPDLTVLENLKIGAYLRTGNIDEDIDWVYQLFPRLKERSWQFGGTLSGGEQQRVAIARALAKNPKLLLCDEPTGALDYNTGKQILKLLQDTCRRDNITVIIITHNSAIAPMADKVIRFKSGRVLETTLNEMPIPVEEIEW